MNETAMEPWLRAGALGGISTAAAGGLTLSVTLSMIGCLIGLLTLAVNFWYKKQMVKIARERMEREFPQ